MVYTALQRHIVESTVASLYGLVGAVLFMVSDAVIGCDMFLFMRLFEYLGHRVGSGKLWPVDSKVEKIRGAARPTTKKELRAFLGLAGFYRRFVPHFSEIALALTDKTKGGQPNKVKWDENCERAFQTLKARLYSSPVVWLPQSDLPYILRTDASEKGLGAVLLQDQGQGPQPVAYASKKLTGPELNYSVIEKECLAVVWGIEKFDPYLYGRTFVLETDHQPLQHLDRVKLANGRLTRPGNYGTCGAGRVIIHIIRRVIPREAPPKSHP
nr:hypothetical protein BaRGS_022457 [Batillaria attramentaria]